MMIVLQASPLLLPLLIGLTFFCRAGCLDSAGAQQCTGYFFESALQRALPPKSFSRWLEHEAAVAVKAAGLPDLFSCPFCGYSAVSQMARGARLVSEGGEVAANTSAFASTRALSFLFCGATNAFPWRGPGLRPWLWRVVDARRATTGAGRGPIDLCLPVARQHGWLRQSLVPGLRQGGAPGHRPLRGRGERRGDQDAPCRGGGARTRKHARKDATHALVVIARIKLGVGRRRGWFESLGNFAPDTSPPQHSFY